MDRKSPGSLAWFVAVVATSLLSAVSPEVFAQEQRSEPPGSVPAQPLPNSPAREFHGLPQDVHQALRWLPEDTESIMFVRGPFQKDFQQEFLRALRGPLFPDLTPVEKLLDFRQEMLLGSPWLFEWSAGEPFFENFLTHEIRFVLKAARRFRPLPVAGKSKYAGADIIVFGEALPAAAVEPKSGERILSPVQIEGNKVVRLQTQRTWGVDECKLIIYYAKPKPSILIAATDPEFLKTLLHSIAQPPVSHTPLLDFPEWKYVDLQSPVWGVRHRRTATPIYIEPKPDKKSLLFSELTGVSFSYETKPTEGVAIRRHFTEKAQDALRQTVANNSDRKMIAPSIVEDRFSFRTQATSDEPKRVPYTDTPPIVGNLMGYLYFP